MPFFIDFCKFTVRLVFIFYFLALSLSCFLFKHIHPSRGFSICVPLSICFESICQTHVSKRDDDCFTPCLSSLFGTHECKWFYNWFWYVHTVQLIDASVELTTMSPTVTSWQFRIAECMHETIHGHTHWNFVNFLIKRKNNLQRSATKSNRDT